MNTKNYKRLSLSERVYIEESLRSLINLRTTNIYIYSAIILTMDNIFEKINKFNVFQRIFISLIITCLISIICTTLMICAYLIPTNGLIQTNITKSAQLLSYEKDFQPVLGNATEQVLAITLDNYTESSMLIESGMPIVDNPISDAMLNYYNLDTNMEQKETLEDLYLHGGDKFRNLLSYGRYWHGYLILLKPLLLITNYGWIRLLLSVTQIILISILAIMLSRKRKLSVFYALLLSYILVGPVAIMQNIQFSTCFNLMMVSVILIIAFKNLLFKYKNIYIYF